MKNKRSVIIIVAIILVSCMIFAYWIYQNNNNNMSYKIENDKLYITCNSKEWIEVPFNVSYTIKHLNEEHKGKYEDGTYQLDNKKIIFYAEIPNEEQMTYDIQGNAIGINEASYDGKYLIYIIYSNDKGKNWEHTLIGSSDYRDCFTSIKFENKNNGKMTLKTRANTGIYNYITKDGGKEWLVQYDDEYELTNMKLHYTDSLKQIPKDITPTEAAEQGYFVYDCVKNQTYNEEVLNEFVKNTEMNAQNRIADEIIMVIYSMEGNPVIYNLGYKYNENVGYILAKDYTRTNYSKMNVLEDIKDIVVDIDIPDEYYGITVKDSGFLSQIISLTSYSEDYDDIEIARYVKNNS